ncbi:MAG: MBL fold metallo-hydrolase [Thermoleophilaceae bacterium]|nr:MBL fold metallo-hydrolase [Thermoleophilaceae bacterium]
MERYICVTCGTQFAASQSPPRSCPICTDPRQYVPPAGQGWTTLAELRADHTNAIRAEGDLVGIGTEPSFAIGQRALLVPFGDSNVLWDCITLLDDATADEIERRGGLAGIAISHPHYYSGMVEWAHRFDCPIHLHAADAEWVMRPDAAIQHWDGDVHDLGHGLTLLRGGGHFPGGTILHLDDGASALLTGDIIQVIPDRTHVAFMWSYPNYVPLPEAAVRSIAAAVEPFRYDAIYGAWWGFVVPTGARDVVRRSVERYGAALRGEL